MKKEDVMKLDDIDTTIQTLGPFNIPSPIQREENTLNRCFVDDTDKVVLDVKLKNLIQTVEKGKNFNAFELAGPRKKIYFDPSKLRCALVTCGGFKRYHSSNRSGAFLRLRRQKYFRLQIRSSGIYSRVST